MRETKIKIDTAVSGKECLECVKSKRYDIIFLDHLMPEMDGIETLHQMKLLTDHPNKDTSVIMLTANAIIGAREEYLKEGFSDYLTKPIQETELLEMIRKYLPEHLICEVEEEPAPQEPLQSEVIEDMAGEETGYMKKLEELEGLDVQTGLKYCMNEEDLYIEILKEYMQGNKASRIQQLFEEKDWENYRVLVHALKGTSLTIGATHLSEGAKALEMAAKDGDVEYITLHHKDTFEEYIDLVDRLKTILA